MRTITKTTKKTATKVAAVLMSACLLMGSLPAVPGMNRKVHAAETELEGYSTKEQLLSNYSLDGKPGKKIQRVKFGENGNGKAQSWYIAGMDPGEEDGLVLFAATPLKEKQAFHHTGDKQRFRNSWGCEYQNNPERVNSNHYGGSDLRNLLGEMSRNLAYFSEAEQNLVRETTVKTEDVENQSIYMTRDKLYLPYGDFKDSEFGKTISLGTSNGDDLRGGLQINLDKYKYKDGVENNFWLRSPCVMYNYMTQIARPAGAISTEMTVDKMDVVPAFQLDLSSVIFASAAPAASADESYVTEGEDFTLRYDAEGAIGSVAILNHNTVEVSGTAEDRYLVVQNDQGAWTKKVDEETSVAADEVTIGETQLTSFEDCRVWLERTDADRITRATKPEQTEKKATVTFKDYNGTVLDMQKVICGEAAKEPKAPVRTGYTFTGWDKDFKKVTEKLEITAQYKKNPEPAKPDNSGNPAKTPAAPSAQKVVRPSISVSKKEILSGKSFRLSVKNRIKGASVSYKTSNKKIATVNQSGTVKGVRAGNATITTTVRQGGKTYSLKTSVKIKGYVKFTKVKKTIKKGKSYKFKAKTYGIKGKMKWSLSSKKMGKISKSGTFKAKKKGKVYVIVKVGKYSAKYRVKVK